jgi:hypothetical protein
LNECLADRYVLAYVEVEFEAQSVAWCGSCEQGSSTGPRRIPDLLFPILAAGGSRSRGAQTAPVHSPWLTSLDSLLSLAHPQLRLEQQQLRPKDGNGKFSYQDSDVVLTVVYRYIDFTKSKQLPASSRRWEGPSCEEAVVEALSTLGRGPLSGGLLRKITKFCHGCLLVSHCLFDSKALSLVNIIQVVMFILFLPS